jgi:hypothetical protein
LARPRAKAEYGDFQTPPALAAAVARVVAGWSPAPATIVEPTCGVGNLLAAARTTLGPAPRLVGLELNPAHLAEARARLEGATLQHQDALSLDWPAFLSELQGPLLVLGNPPWVTNAQLGALGSANLPRKENQGRRPGLEALTGRSNFDLSEWLALQLMEALQGRDATLALLLKAAVARRLLHHAWARGWAVRDPALLRIDAARHFGADVEACLFVCKLGCASPARCPVYDDLEGGAATGVIGAAPDGTLVADLDAWHRTRGLAGPGGATWRSGVKHDCARILELRRGEGGLQNGLGARVEVEPEVLYPLLKSSDVARGRLEAERWLLLPQTSPGEDPARLAQAAPRAWEYLMEHGAALDARRSRIYRQRPRFSVFGVGPYSFSPWKVAVSGLYKSLTFRVVGPRHGRPVLFDDTVYLLPCAGEAEARGLAARLASPEVQAFFAARVFWDAKRPITAQLLRQLDLARLTARGGDADRSACY